MIYEVGQWQWGGYVILSLMGDRSRTPGGNSYPPPPRGGYLVHVWATLDFMTLFRTKDKIYLVEVLLGRQSCNYTLFRNSDVISLC